MTDQSGAFPETLREAALWEALKTYGQHRVGCPHPSCPDCRTHTMAASKTPGYSYCTRCGRGSIPTSDEACDCGFAAALERPRPAPPEPWREAMERLIQRVESHEHVDARDRSAIAAARDLLATPARPSDDEINDLSSAGTGVAPSDPHEVAIEKRVSEIRARLNAATPGPWRTVAIPAAESELAIPHDEGHTGPCICGERVEHVDLFREYVEVAPVEGQHRPADGINVLRADMANLKQENVACLVHVAEDEPNVALIKNAPEDIRFLLHLLESDVELTRHAERNPSGVPREETNPSGGSPAAPSPEAPSGPWRVEPSTQFVDYWTVTYNAPVDAAPRNLPPAVGPICTEAEAIAVRDALNQVASSQGGKQ